MGEPPPGGWKLRGAWEAGETQAKTLWQTILVMELELGSVIDGEVLSEQGPGQIFIIEKWLLAHSTAQGYPEKGNRKA